ncbi:MAG: HEAT repeat domain-containing protein, partial [Chloroflexia bacterium]
VQALLAALKDDYLTVRMGAEESLGQLAQSSPEVVQALLAALKDDDPSVRTSAALSLAQLAQSSPEVVQALLAALKDDASYVRMSAADSLRQLAQSSPEVVQALLAALKDDDPYMQDSALISLLTLGYEPENWEENLYSIVRKQDPYNEVKARAISFLGETGDGNPLQVGLLMKGLRDEGDQVRQASTLALARIGQRSTERGKNIAEQLAQAINSSEFDMSIRNGTRTGQDYAFSALWMLVAGEGSSQ